MVRFLFAGDAGPFTWAGQLGAHLRPLDVAPAPGNPRGSELLFGAAAGARVAVGASRSWAVVVGPELWGATPFATFFGSSATAVEGLLTGRIEGTGDDGLQLRVKLGAGAGLNAHAGASEWRMVCAIEMFNHRAK
jgi:hypothetical protein